MENPFKITKTDFLVFLECPMHFWAKLNDHYEAEPTAFTESLIRQGYEVERLAQAYLQQFVILPDPALHLSLQQSFTDAPFYARADALVRKSVSQSFDLYEIKSGTSIDKKDVYDCCFQYQVLRQQLNIERVYVLHLNRDYVRGDALDLAQLFIAEEVTAEVMATLPGVQLEMQNALIIAQQPAPNGLVHCYNPKNCPCKQLCHPNLPIHSIYDIGYLNKNKKRELEGMGILEAAKVPESFPLNPVQRSFIHAVQQNQPQIDRAGIRKGLEKLEFPLYFLDYETFNTAIPLYPGYHPQQQMVFQYSLHCLDRPGGSLSHTEYLCTEKVEPAVGLLETLKSGIGPTGSVLVWNKSFEMTRNNEMAEVHSNYQSFLEDLNARIYDLADFVRQGLYLHPGFKGSWSIKNVLPVMVPDLSYQDMAIIEGGQASEAWWQMVYGDMEAGQKEQTRQALLKYCHLDTLAMVRIYECLASLDN